MTVVDRFVQAVAHGGAMRPTLQVVHSAETPLRAGYAASIAENWFGKTAPTSAHFMIDPVETIRMLSDNVVSYAVGPKANGFTLNWEQAGRASFTRAEWTTSDGLAQVRRLGHGIRERGLVNGIPLRWATDDDIRAAARGVPGGVCFHDDIRRVLGGTSHTDPIPNYPRDLLEQAWGGDVQEDELSAEFEKDARAMLGAIAYALLPEGGLREPAGAVINRLGALQYALIPEGGLGSQGEIALRVRMIQSLVSDPAAFAAALAPHLQDGVVDQAAVEAGVRAVLGSLDAA